MLTRQQTGIGLRLVSLLLVRPDTTVIATVRSDTTDINELRALQQDATSNLIVSYLSTEELKSPGALLSSLTSNYNITHIDTLVVNAGYSTFKPILGASIQSIKDSFEINTFLPITLFQTLHPLLAKSNTPKFVYISSALGSIELLGQEIGAFPILAYGAAKAAAGYFTRKVHFEFPNLVSVTIHPG